jgi:hypothetical protein
MSSSKIIACKGTLFEVYSINREGGGGELNQRKWERGNSSQSWV